MMKPVITVKEARELLGKDYDKLSDERIEEVINLLSLIAKETLEKASHGELPNQEHRPSRLSPDSND